jgi:hypothetical protein
MAANFWLFTIHRQLDCDRGAINMELLGALASLAKGGAPYPVAPNRACCDRLNRNNFNRLWLAAIWCHSGSTFSMPLCRKLRRPLTSLI